MTGELEEVLQSGFLKGKPCVYGYLVMYPTSDNRLVYMDRDFNIKNLYQCHGPDTFDCYENPIYCHSDYSPVYQVVISGNIKRHDYSRVSGEFLYIYKCAHEKKYMTTNKKPWKNGCWRYENDTELRTYSLIVLLDGQLTCYHLVRYGVFIVMMLKNTTTINDRQFIKTCL